MIIFICSKLNHLFWKLFTQYLFFWSSNLFTFTSMDKRKSSEKKFSWINISNYIFLPNLEEHILHIWIMCLLFSQKRTKGVNGLWLLWNAGKSKMAALVKKTWISSFPLSQMVCFVGFVACFWAIPKVRRSLASLRIH